jgi:lon-related putative ATP-dependent protease
MAKLNAQKLRRKFDYRILNSKSTEEMSPLRGIIGQERATRALDFGVAIQEHGFNIYVAGHPGTGRTTTVMDLLDQVAKKKSVPSDWCYVNNFDNAYEPKVVELPPGKGKIFQADMDGLIKSALRLLPKAFKTEQYATRKEAITKTIEEERNKLLAQLNKRADDEGFTLQITPVAVLLIPVVKGQPLTDQEFMSLDPKTRKETQEKREKLWEELRSGIVQLKNLEGKISEEIEKLNREVALYTIKHLVSSLTEKYKEFQKVLTYIAEVREDILGDIAQFIDLEPSQSHIDADSPLRKYQVNVIVDNSKLRGAPVLKEFNPTYQNLFGRIEKETRSGVLTTDFTLIRSGSLHKANGGYLVIPVEELIRADLSWDSLKASLTNRCLSIEDPGERLGLVTTRSLKPATVPLNLKVILIGNPILHQLLYTMDKDFKDLFKVKADFDTTMNRTKENALKYAGFICGLCRKEKMKHLDASAVAKIIEHGSRLAEDQQKLSTRFADIADIIREANFYASQEDAKYVTSAHVERAIEEKIHRSNLIQKRIQEMIQRGVILVDTAGEAVGQVNGLSVISLGDFDFGMPSRVTVSVGMGREGIIDIEREAMLGGRIHTKGVMILGGYLADKYAREKPLSLSARLVFEQSYEEIEGDSASSTELYAILSALSGLPIKAGIAVTGSVNQKGQVQAIGGANEKIEGFFEVCKTKGFTGKQGVIIPESNVQNLMLKEEIVDAVKARKFHIYTVKNIDKGIEILTGVKAGARRSDGTFQKDTVNYKVDKRLKEMAEKLKEFPEFVVRKP